MRFYILKMFKLKHTIFQKPFIALGILHKCFGINIYFSMSIIIIV